MKLSRRRPKHSKETLLFQVSAEVLMLQLSGLYCKVKTEDPRDLGGVQEDSPRIVGVPTGRDRMEIMLQPVRSIAVKCRPGRC